MYVFVKADQLLTATTKSHITHLTPITHNINTSHVSNTSLTHHTCIHNKHLGPGTFKVAMTRLIKSSSLEAVYSPNIIAVGFESGAAAFCSILKVI